MIVERATNKGKTPGAPASSSGSSKWSKAAGPVLAATPKAAPAAIHPIVKAPPELPLRPTRSIPPTQSVDPPAKKQKPAADLNPYGQKAGKGKGSKSRPGSVDNWNQGWRDDRRNRGHQQPPDPPPYSGKGRQGSRDAPREFRPRANECKDVRETDRLHREREERECAETENSEAYKWWATAWQPRARSVRPGAGHEGDQSYRSYADNRSYERHEHSRVDNRSGSAWTPSVPPAGRRAGRDRTRSPNDRRVFFPGRECNRGNQDGWVSRRVEPAPRNEQWDWDEDQWARFNERSRRHEWSGR